MVPGPPARPPVLLSASRVSTWPPRWWKCRCSSNSCASWARPNEPVQARHAGRLSLRAYRRDVSGALLRPLAQRLGDPPRRRVFLAGRARLRHSRLLLRRRGRQRRLYERLQPRAMSSAAARFTEAGDSAICFVGSLETTVGTQRNFPYECRVENNLIHDCGVFGKQMAGIYISRAKRITAAHNEIYSHAARGICIGDGTWGGHVIEYNHFHDTCRETGDHGPFNAWGRDRYWCLVQSHSHLAGGDSHSAGHVQIDAMEPTSSCATTSSRRRPAGARPGRRRLELRDLQQPLRGREREAARRRLPHDLQQHLGQRRQLALLPRRQRRQPRPLLPQYHRHEHRPDDARRWT